MPYSTDIKDYYRRAWGLKDRVPFKYGGSWADWKTNFSDQMTFEEYLQMDLKTKKPHILDRKADGGRIGLRSGTATLPYLTRGWSRPGVHKAWTKEKLAEALGGSTIAAGAYKFIPEVHGGKGPIPADPPETFPDESEKWADSYKDAGTKIPEQTKAEPPVSGGIILPPQLGGSEIPETKKEDLIFTSETAEKMVEEDDHSQDEDVVEVE